MKNQEQKTILLVEDDAVTAMVEKHLLKSFGYDVVTAKSGEEAVQIATGNDKINLILMDINLDSGMDGAEAARQILGKRPLPIVFLSSHTEKEYTERVKRITSYGYVLKNSGDFVLQSSIEMALNLFTAQEALRESEAKYKTLITGAPEGILVVDLQAKQIRYGNPAICGMFGYTEEEFMRLGVADIHQKESLDHVLADFETLLQDKKVFSPDIPCLRKDGTVFYANVNGIMIVLEGRKCGVGFFTDITEHKRMEQLKDEQRYLRQLAVITRELHDGIGGVTASIGILTEVGRRQAVAEADKKIFINIADMIAEVNMEIHGLMNTVENYTIEWPDWVAECRQHGTSLMAAHDMAFNMQVKGDIDVVKCPDLVAYMSLLRIFKEALTNIIKHSGASRVNVLIQFEPNRFLMEIRDNGRGFAPDNVPGRGLGNMRKRITEFYGGAMIARTHNGAELKFEFPLPLKLVEEKVVGLPVKLN